MPWEAIGRTLFGIFVGIICGFVSLIVGFILGKGSGGAVSMFVCVLSGGVFGFIEKSAVLTVIVSIIAILFMVADKSKPVPRKKAQQIRERSQFKGDSDEINTASEIDDNRKI